MAGEIALKLLAGRPPYSLWRVKEPSMTERPSAHLSAELTLLNDEEFSDRWRALVGEPPAIMLPDRAEMIQLLVESVASAHPVADCEEVGRHIAGLRTVRKCRGE